MFKNSDISERLPLASFTHKCEEICISNNFKKNLINCHFKYLLRKSDGNISMHVPIRQEDISSKPDRDVLLQHEMKVRAMSVSSKITNNKNNFRVKWAENQHSLTTLSECLNK